jgi:hypothetical protein
MLLLRCRLVTTTAVRLSKIAENAISVCPGKRLLLTERNWRSWDVAACGHGAAVPCPSRAPFSEDVSQIPVLRVLRPFVL